MVRWYVGFAALLLLISATAMAQPFVAVWSYTPDMGAPLTTVCPPNGTTPLPDGRVVKIYWDSNSNGPDASDPLAPLCTDAPTCEQGPSGTVNFNQFALNGQGLGYGAGYFYTDATFTSAYDLTNPPRFYLRVFDATGVNFLWTSRVFTLVPSYQDVILQFSDWTCGQGGPQCVVRDEHE